MGVLYVRDVDTNTWKPTGTQGPQGPQGPPGSSAITSPLVIPDPVGVNYPAIRFGDGDGANGTGPNPYFYEFNLYNDSLRLFSGRNPARAVAEFVSPSADVGEIRINANWAIEDRNDSYLRFFHGADRAAAEMYIASNGTFGCGPILCASVSTTGAINSAGTVTVTNKTVSGNGGLFLHAVNASSTNIQVGMANGSPSPILYIASSPTANGWNDRPLCVAKHSGAGECAIGFVNHVNGWTAGFQMYSDGSLYLASVNGANSGVIKMQASQFQVISTGKFKAEQTVLAGSLARRIIEHVKPVRFRDLQHEMAFEASSEPAHNVVREPQPPVEPLYRYGLIAEEVAEIIPELSDETRYGRGLDLSGLIAVMWKGMKELFEEVTALRQELEDIKGAAT